MLEVNFFTQHIRMDRPTATLQHQHGLLLLLLLQNIQTEATMLKVNFSTQHIRNHRRRRRRAMALLERPIPIRHHLMLKNLSLTFTVNPCTRQFLNI